MLNESFTAGTFYIAENKMATSDTYHPTQSSFKVTLPFLPWRGGLLFPFLVSGKILYWQKLQYMTSKGSH